MNQIVGYAAIKEDANTIVSVDSNSFKAQTVRVLEFCRFDDSILCVNREATALATIEGEDILSSFKCTEISNDMIGPPDMDTIESFMYLTKCYNRKGGYEPLLKQMVIGASIHSGEFNDKFLWSKQ